MTGTPQLDGPWHGVLRQEIDWHPSVDEGLCSGCGLCVTSCGRKVFEYDFGRRKTVVARAQLAAMQGAGV
jgi:CDP-4-dehydro-6-deoxyglucose reductase, E3